MERLVTTLILFMMVIVLFFIVMVLIGMVVALYKMFVIFVDCVGCGAVNNGCDIVIDSCGAVFLLL